MGDFNSPGLDEDRLGLILWILGVWQRSKNLSEPLLGDSDVPIEVGQTWRGSRGRSPVVDLEGGLETAVTVGSDFSNDKKFNVPKEVLTAGEVSKARVATSNVNSQSEFQFNLCYVIPYFKRDFNM